MTNFKYISSYLATAVLVLAAVMAFHAVPAVAYGHGGGSSYGSGSYYGGDCGSCDYGGSSYGNGGYDCGSCGYVPPVDCGCDYTPPTPVTLTATCTANPSSVNVGDSITWSAQATGGSGSYTYSWSGSVNGSGQTQSLAYSVAGTKNATVTVRSGTQSVTASCQGVVNNNVPPVNNLSATCTANPSSINAGDTITWTAQPSGGDGNYTYSWSGAVYGSGQTQSLSYSVVGTKNATVTVHSGNQSVTASCQGYVNNNYVPPYYPPNQNLSVYCYANPGTVNAGNRVDWYANASGGNGNYTYSWSGSNITTNGQSAYAVYQYPGTQNAYVTVYSNGQSVSANCSVLVNSVGSVTINQNPTGNLSSGVYLSTVPYTGAGPNWKISLFVLGLVMWSAFVAFMILKKRGILATAGGSLGETSMAERIAEFKRLNQLRKNS